MSNERGAGRKTGDLSFTPKMRTAIEFIIANPTACYNDIAKAAGVTKPCICRWKKHPLFQEELQKRLKEVWGEATAVAQQKMIEMAANGDYRACEFILKAQGYMDDTQQQMALNINIVPKRNDESAE